MSEELTEQTEQSEELKIESLDDLTRIAEEASGEESPIEQTQQTEETEQVDEPSAYDPVYTYTVRDQEKEFDERIRDSIKDKDTEDLVRELYTKAEGLDAYKEKFSKRDSEYGQLHEQTQALTDGYKTLLDLRNKKDYRGLQEALGLDQDFVVDWGVNVLKEDELPPEQKEMLKRQREMQQQINGFQSEVGQYKSQLSEYEKANQDTVVQSQLQELKSLALNEDNRPVVQAMDAYGKDFVDAVMEKGKHLYSLEGAEPEVSRVVDLVVRENRIFLEQQQLQSQLKELSPQQQQQSTQPTLPSINGVNQATVEQPITSLADLKKLGETF